MIRIRTVLLALALPILIMACGTMQRGTKKPIAAKQKLEQMNIPFSADEFVRQAGNRDTGALQLFLDANMNPDSKGKYGRTALIQATYLCNTDAVRLLLANGASVNAKDETGMTALAHTARSCNTETMSALLENGVGIFQEDDLAFAAFIFAHGIPNITSDDIKFRLICWWCEGFESTMQEAMENRGEWLAVLDVLKEGGGTALEKYGMTDLMWAATQYDEKRVKELLEKGAEPNAKDKYGWTALAFATKNGDVEAVKTLLENGADPSIEYEWGGAITALQVAELFDLAEIAALLKGIEARK